MIIKSMARKAPTFGQLIGYIGRNAGDQEVFAHNLYHSGINTDWVETQFRENYQNLPDRKNGNALYHEILALEPQPHLSQQQVSERLRRIAEAYCDMRAPDHLIWGKTHHDTDFPHVHLMISSNAVNSNQRRRLTKAQFTEAQSATEIFAREHFPELNVTPVYTRSTPPELIKRSRAEGELERRSGEPSRKQITAQMVQDGLNQSDNMERLSQFLNDNGLALKQRGNKWSVEDMRSSKRYRLQTLGLASTFENWQKRETSQNTPNPKKPDSARIDPRRVELEQLAAKRLEDFERFDRGEQER